MLNELLEMWLGVNVAYVIFRIKAGPSKPAPKPNPTLAYFKKMGITITEEKQ